MKTMLFFGLMLLGCVRLLAQSQELQQLKLDLEKLAQFKLILSNMKQGYQTLQSGYNAVRDVAKGNFNLHKNYLDGLMQVNASVRHTPAIQQISKDQAAITAEFQKAWKLFVPCGLFNADELAAFRLHYDEAKANVADELDMLSLVLSNGVLRMSDEERLQFITAIRGNVSAQLGTLQGTISDYTKTMALRIQQKKDVEAVKRLKGIK